MVMVCAIDWNVYTRRRRRRRRNISEVRNMCLSVSVSVSSVHRNEDGWRRS